MADETSPEAASRDAEEFTRLWFERIDGRLNADDWKSWLDEADKCEKRYSLEKGATDKRFNVFYANVETIGAAIYNSEPTPDVRRRFGDADPAGKMASDVTERAISASCDLYDFDNVLGGAVHNGEVVGIGLARVRFDTKFGPAPQMGHNGGPPLSEDPENTATESEAQPEGEGPIAWQSVWCDAVDWRDLVMSDATAWEGVEFIAYRHRFDREAVSKINPEVGAVIKLAQWEDGRGNRKGRKVNDDRDDKFKRGEVWEVWYKPARQVIWLARDWPEAPLAVKPDPLGLREFWPMPRPYMPVQKPHDMTPVPPYRLYAQQAKELNTISVRIAELTAAAVWRGVYDSTFASAFKAMEGLKDGELAPISDAMAWKDKGFAAAVFLMPVEQLVGVLKQLHADRDAVKQTIYELIGVADIMRGSSAASETLGAQELKTQWGSLRVNRRQKAVQRFGRDLFRLKAEIIGKKFAPHVLSMMTGIDLQPAPVQLPPQVMAAAQSGQVPPELQQMLEQAKAQAEKVQIATAALELLRGDMEREYRIDIETDSTVQADVQQSQTNAAQFLQGLGLFTQAVAPAIEAGMMQGDEAADILTGVSRSFKLGRQAEDAIERMGKRLQEQAKQPKQEKPDPEAVKAQAESQRMQMEAGIRQQEAQADMAGKQQDAQLKAQLGEMDMAMKQREAEMRERELAMEFEFKQREHALRMREMELTAAFAERKHAADVEMVGVKAEAAKKAARQPRADA